MFAPTGYEGRAYLQEGFESTPREGYDRRQWLDNQVANEGVFVQVNEKRINMVPHQDFLSTTISILPLAALTLISLFLSLLDKHLQYVQLSRVLGVGFKREEFLVIVVEPLYSFLPESRSNTVRNRGGSGGS